MLRHHRSTFVSEFCTLFGVVTIQMSDLLLTPDLRVQGLHGGRQAGVAAGRAGQRGRSQQPADRAGDAGGGPRGHLPRPQPRPQRAQRQRRECARGGRRAAAEGDARGAEPGVPDGRLPGVLAALLHLDAAGHRHGECCPVLLSSCRQGQDFRYVIFNMPII